MSISDVLAGLIAWLDNMIIWIMIKVIFKFMVHFVQVVFKLQMKKTLNLFWFDKLDHFGPILSDMFQNMDDMIYTI